MSDLLVRLWELPPLEPALAACASHGVTVRRALAPEKPVVLDFARRLGLGEVHDRAPAQRPTPFGLAAMERFLAALPPL